jgi:AraC-like DNA-binding protein
VRPVRDYGVEHGQILEEMRFMMRIRAAVGNHWRPVAVGLTHRQPADLTEYGQRVGSRISFNQPANSITISAATLAMPMPNADPQLFKLVKRYCEEEIERQKVDDHPLNRIRETMIRCLQQGSFGPKHIAKEFGLTPSGLHRRLKAEGTSFQRLLDDTRRCLTHRYLLESSLKLTDIAARVGYSELSAFSRAARLWFGTSPRSFRRRPPSLGAAA